MTEQPIIQAARNQPVQTTPIWMMRQAGRFLPEYHETKEKAGGFLGLCKIPEYGVEVALQPIRRFDLDAAILFSDILIPAEAMGLELTFNPGPVFARPVRQEADVDALIVPDPLSAMPFVMEMLTTLRQTLPAEKAIIGFCGAPYTVASYMIEGRSSPNLEHTRTMLYSRPDLLHRLLEKVTATNLHYLQAQVRAGAEIISLFDSSAYSLPPVAYQEFALTYAHQMISALSETGVPIIYFAPGSMALLEQMATLGAQVIGVDWRIGLGKARKRLGAEQAVQGNLDPAALLGTPAAVKEHVRRILDENEGRPGHIFNLGHGVLPSTPPENVETMVAAVRGEI